MTGTASLDPRLATGLVALGALLSFAPGLGNEFLGDDRILLGPRLEGVGWAQLPGLLRENYWGPVAVAQHYRPLGVLLLAVERLLFGELTAPYHAVALLGHLACSLLVLRLLRLLGFEAAAFAAALLFAVHPIHAEVMLTVYGQLDLFASLAVLVGLERTVVAHRTGRTGPQLVAWMVYAVGIGFKESAAVLPALTALVRGLCLTPEARGVGRWVTRAELGFALPLAIMLALRWPVLGGLTPPIEKTFAEGQPFEMRVRLVVASVGNALRLVFAPSGQTTFYGAMPDSLGGLPWREIAWLTGAPLFAWLSARKLGATVALFAVGWFALTVAPIANIVPVFVVVAERSLYLPALSATLLVGAWLALADASGRRRLATIALAGLVVLAVAVSWRVTHHWRTELSMWLYTAYAHPNNPTALSAAGGVFLNRHHDERRLTPRAEDVETADLFFSAALALNPHMSDALLGKAGVALARDDCRAALDYLNRARRLRPLEPRVEHQRRLCLEELRGARSPEGTDPARSP